MPLESLANLFWARYWRLVGCALSGKRNNEQKRATVPVLAAREHRWKHGRKHRLAVLVAEWEHGWVPGLALLQVARHEHEWNHGWNTGEFPGYSSGSKSRVRTQVNSRANGSISRMRIRVNTRASGSYSRMGTQVNSRASSSNSRVRTRVRTQVNSRASA